jgi:hypothetical protein
MKVASKEGKADIAKSIHDMVLVFEIALRFMATPPGNALN